MAEEVLYSSVGGESNKRKATGFSSPPDSAAPTPAYNSVPPPMNEIELAKQKAQEIAARLLSNADPLKRARVDNGGGGGGGGFDSSDYGAPKPMGMSFSGSPQVASSGYPGPSKKIEIPNGRVGVIIGKGGETIKYLQLQSGAKIQVTRDVDADPNSTTRGVDLMGTPDQIAKAEQLINDVLSEAETGGSGAVSRRLTGQTPGSEQFVMKVANNKVGLVIGKGGETIKNMQARTGARIQVIPLHLPPGDMSKERTVQIEGTSEQIDAARQLVEEVTSENRVRNPSMSGGYPQQGYQARPPNNWGQPMQQPGYGYTQPSAYPGQSAQYNMNQSSYPGYPPQPTSGYANATGWDQSTAPQNQQTPQGGGYDYYNQQQQQPPQQQQQTQGGGNPSQDGSGYNYSQASTYSYGQDGYGAYNAQSGYDQQAYNANYGNVSNNPTSEGPTASYGTQGEAANQGPTSEQTYNVNSVSQSQPSSYPPQGGYGPPQPQKAAPVYSQPQSGYAQTDTGSQRPPSSYPVGYGAPPYGAPPAGQPGYAQYQAPGAYNGAYGGGGYSQPPLSYSSDATPVPQSAQPSGAPKASPPS